ncbi:MAG: hypothetical protein AB1546_05555 [bacterium]
MPCDSSEYPEKCVIILKNDISGAELLSETISASGVDIPKAGGGRKEIGNADCDDEIGFNDLKELKKSYKKNVGAGADAWADFNCDGTVGFDDLKILKKYYKMKVYDSDNIDKSDATFCKTSQ